MSSWLPVSFYVAFMSESVEGLSWCKTKCRFAGAARIHPAPMARRAWVSTESHTPISCVSWRGKNRVSLKTLRSRTSWHHLLADCESLSHFLADCRALWDFEHEIWRAGADKFGCQPKQRSDLWRAQLVSVPLRLPGRIHDIRAYWVNLLSIWVILDVSGPIWNSVRNRVWNCALSPEAMCLVPRCLQWANSIHARQPLTCESGPEPMPQAHLSRDVKSVKSVKSVKLLDTVPYCTGWAGNQQIAFRLAAPVTCKTCKSKLTVCIAEGSLQWHGAQINCKSGEHPIGSNWVLHILHRALYALFIPRRLHDEGAHGSILILAHSKRVQLAQLHQTGQHQSCCWAIPDVTPYSRSNIFRRSKRKKAASLSECAFGCYTPLSRFMIASLMITNDHLESMIRDCVCSGWKKAFMPSMVVFDMAWTCLDVALAASACFSLLLGNSHLRCDVQITGRCKGRCL